MNGTRGRWILAAAVCAGLTGTQSGCSGLYMHDKGRSEAVKGAKTSFGEFAKKSPDRYDAMVKNLQRIATEEDALLAELAGNTDLTRVTLNPDASFGQLAAEAKTAQAKLDKFEGTLRESILSKLKADDDRKAAAKTAADAVAAAQKDVEAAKTRVTKWNATEAVLLKAIESLPEARAAGKGKPLGDALAAGATALGNQKVTYHDANGKEVTATISELATEAVGNANTGLTKSGAGKSSLTELLNAPGADLVIMNLALELAKIEQRRAKLAQQRADALADLSSEAFVAATVAGQLLREAGGELDDLSMPAPQGYGTNVAPVTAIAQVRGQIAAARATAQETATRAVGAKAAAVAAAQKPLADKLAADRQAAAKEEVRLAAVQKQLAADKVTVAQKQARLDAEALKIKDMPAGQPKDDAAKALADAVAAFTVEQQSFDAVGRVLIEDQKKLAAAVQKLTADQANFNNEVGRGDAAVAQARRDAVAKQHTEVADAERDANHAVAGMLGAQRKAAVARAMAIRVMSTFELQVARAGHEDSIADSALNDEQWRTVIASGIEGLDQYYENGVRPEDVANYIRLGQAVATFVIAGKVD